MKKTSSDNSELLMYLSVLVLKEAPTEIITYR
jgi:hypothetical protein